MTEMEQEIIERERENLGYEMEKLKKEIESDFALINEMRARIESYKKEICRLKLDRQIRIG